MDFLSSPGEAAAGKLAGDAPAGVAGVAAAAAATTVAAEAGGIIGTGLDGTG